MVFATVPAAPPTEKNHRATSWPAPISANVPYVVASRLSANAFCRVFEALSSICFEPNCRILEDGSDHTTIYSQCCAISNSCFSYASGKRNLCGLRYSIVDHSETNAQR